MRTLSRRRFAGLLASAPLIPTLGDSLFQQSPPPSDPDKNEKKLAGSVVPADDQRLAKLFLENHEKSIALLRSRDLPNDLPPFDACVFMTQRKTKR